MGKHPVYQSPLLDQVEERMRPDPSYRHGYLGSDPRKLIQILMEDHKTVTSLGLTHEMIAERLRRITAAAARGMGDPVLIDNRHIVKVQAARGKIPCPWGHPGLYPKTHTELRCTECDKILAWSDLSLHMIEAHGFYQGKGSPYRLEPEDIGRFLFASESRG